MREREREREREKDEDLMASRPNGSGVRVQFLRVGT